MSNFSYNLTLIGDCNQSNSGYALIEITGGGTPPYNFQWPYDLGSDLGVENSQRGNLSADTYIITITDSSNINNSNLTDYLSVIISSGVCCSIKGIVPTTCGLYNGIVTGSTGIFSPTNYALYTQSDNFVVSANTNLDSIVFQNLSADTYYFLVTDSGGCTGKSQSFIINQSPTFDYNLYVVPNSTCSTGDFGKIYVTDLNGVGPYLYTWSNGKITDSITGLSNGSYSVTVTDSSGCQLTKSATITTVDKLGLVGITAVEPGCFTKNGSLTFTFSGGTLPIYYSASTGNYQISYERTFTISNIAAGTYSVLATDAAHCKISPIATLNTSLGINAVNVTTQNSSCSDSDGLISVNVAGGAPPYNYVLIKPDGDSLNETSLSITKIYNGLSGGTYTLFVTDENNCTFQNEYTLITENKFTLSTKTTGSTVLANTGIIEVTKSVGGSLPFDYTLDRSSTIRTPFSSVTFTNVSIGSHLIEVTDANGCRQRAQVFINTIPSIDFTLVSTDIIESNDGTLTAMIFDGEPPFVFNWSNNVKNNPQQIFVDSLSAGTYSLTISDANGTSMTKTKTINKLTNIASYNLYEVGKEQFQIQTGIKNAMINLLNEGFYELTSDNTECQLISATFTVEVLQLPEGITSQETFFTTNSLLEGPTDNEWFNSVRNLLLRIRGVYDVKIDEINNQITIIGDLNNQSIVDTLEIRISVKINYDIICLT